jgi:hypothetical protein
MDCKRYEQRPKPGVRGIQLLRVLPISPILHTLLPEHLESPNPPREVQDQPLMTLPRVQSIVPGAPYGPSQSRNKAEN